MKKLFIGILVIAFATTLHAQTETPANGTPKKEWKRNRDGNEAMEKVNLTEAQKAQMKTINNDLRNQLQAVKNDASLTQEAQKEKRRQIMKDHNNKVENILTADQKKQWKETRKNAIKNRRDKKDNDDNEDNDDKTGSNRSHKDGKEQRGMDADKMVNDLNLTPDQTKRMKQIHQDYKTSAEAIKSNTALTNEQRKEQMKALHEKHKAAMDQTLTSDQKAKMKTLKPHKRKGEHEGKGDGITK